MSSTSGAVGVAAAVGVVVAVGVAVKVGVSGCGEGVMLGAGVAVAVAVAVSVAWVGSAVGVASEDDGLGLTVSVVSSPGSEVPLQPTAINMLDIRMVGRLLAGYICFVLGRLK